MADDVTTQSTTLATIPTATTIATDDASGRHVQFVKLAVPTNGTATAWGDATGGLPVAIAKGTKTLADPAPTTSATSLVASNSSRKGLIIKNAGAVTVYLGKDSGVTTTTGLPLLANESLSDSVSTDAWYGITASGTGDIRVVEVA